MKYEIPAHVFAANAQAFTCTGKPWAKMNKDRELVLFDEAELQAAAERGEPMACVIAAVIAQVRAPLLEAVKANHQWHQLYDEHGGYPDSELYETNTSVLDPKTTTTTYVADNCDGAGRDLPPPPGATIALEALLDSFGDHGDREDAWEVILAYADIRARAAIEAGEPKGTERVSSTWLAQLREEYRQFGEAIPRLQAEIDELRAAQPDLDAMVSRFLSWALPADFHPDGGVSFQPSPHPHAWPVGTNLLTASQAKAMFEHCLDKGGITDIADLFNDADCPMCGDLGSIATSDPVDRPMDTAPCPLCKPKPEELELYDYQGRKVEPDSKAAMFVTRHQHEQVVARLRALVKDMREDGYHGEKVCSDALTALMGFPGPAIDERKAFEEIFPIPANCMRCGDSYAATEFNAWDAQAYTHIRKGWQAALEWQISAACIMAAPAPTTIEFSDSPDGCAAEASYRRAEKAESQHPTENHRPGLRMAAAALQRRQAQYGDAYRIAELLIEQIR